jgi:PAS domain S-box-containing protein
MDIRRDLIDLLRADRPTFRDRIDSVLPTDDWMDTARREALAAGPESERLDGPPELDDYGAHSARTRDLVWRCYLLDHAPLGLTICGPAYRDTPIVYATRTMRALTGYSLDDLRGENPRLLQGPDTEADAVADLREAVEIWEPVTVELWNYRADGTRFRNRLSLVPLPDGTGTVGNWLGVQEAVGTLTEDDAASTEN